MGSTSELPPKKNTPTIDALITEIAKQFVSTTIDPMYPEDEGKPNYYTLRQATSGVLMEIDQTPKDLMFKLLDETPFSAEEIALDDYLGGVSFRTYDEIFFEINVAILVKEAAARSPRIKAENERREQKNDDFDD